MSSASLSRLSGIVLLVGSLLGLVSAAVIDFQFPGRNAPPQQMVAQPWVLETSLLLVGALLISMGFPGFYVLQSARAGKLGFAGFVLLWVGILFGELSFTAIQATMLPWISQVAPNTLKPGSPPFAVGLLFVIGPTLLFLVGSILLGIATLRAGVFGRGPGIALLAIGIITVIAIPLQTGAAGNIANTLFDLWAFVAFAWCGYAVAARKVEPVAAPSMAIPPAQKSR